MGPQQLHTEAVLPPQMYRHTQVLGKHLKEIFYASLLMNTGHPRPSYIDSFVCVPPYRIEHYESLMNL